MHNALDVTLTDMSQQNTPPYRSTRRQATDWLRPVQFLLALTGFGVGSNIPWVGYISVRLYGRVRHSAQHRQRSGRPG